MGTVPANFHGKKGRSGRKTIAEEFLKHQVIKKAWLKKDSKMTDQDATQIVLKDMTNKTELSGSLELQQVTGMKIVKENGK